MKYTFFKSEIVIFYWFFHFFSQKLIFICRRYCYLSPHAVSRKYRNIIFWCYGNTLVNKLRERRRNTLGFLYLLKNHSMKEIVIFIVLFTASPCISFKLALPVSTFRKPRKLWNLKVFFFFITYLRAKLDLT